MDIPVRRWYFFDRESDLQKQFIAPVAGFLMIAVIFVGIIVHINILEYNRLTSKLHQASISFLFKEQQDKIKTELKIFELSKRSENFDYSGTLQNGKGQEPELPVRHILTHAKSIDLPVTGLALISEKIVLFAVNKNEKTTSYIGKIIDQRVLQQFTDNIYFSKLQLTKTPPEQTATFFTLTDYRDQPIGYIRYFPSPGFNEYALTMIASLSLTIILMTIALYIFGLRISRILRAKTQQLDLNNAQAQLTHENLSHFIEGMAEPVLTVDKGGIIMSCNSAAAELFKCSPHDLIGEFFLLKILHQEIDRSRILGIDPSKLSDEDQSLVQVKGYKSDNSPFMMELSITHFPSTGQDEYVIAITNLTELHRDEDLINLVNSALILVDRDANIIIANQHAKKILSELDGLKVEQEKLVSIRESDTSKIHDLINAALKGWGKHGYKRGAMRLYRPSGALPYSLVVLPFQAGNMPENHEIAVVIINDPEKKISYSRKLLKRLYQLTNTEAKVASAIGQGLTLDQIALELEISKNTVRNHLKSIFKKTGTTRQADLVKILTMNATFSGIGKF